MLKLARLLNKYAVLGSVPALLYVLIEIEFRGYSHISMFFVSFVLCIIVGEINEVLPWDMPLYQQQFIATGIITAGELFTGIIVNIILGLHVWDYSNMPFNLWGQICLPFSIVWFFLSILVIVLDDYLRYWFFGEEKPHYKLI